MNFLKEAQRLALPNWMNATFGPNANVVPVELAAADIFDFHLVNPSSTYCVSLTGTETPNALASCIANATVMALPAQVDLSTVNGALINSTSNLVKTLGVGLLNSYLHKLGVSEQNYTNLNDNFLVDLHGSQAEYAINFGILSDVLNQDSQTNVANATCHTAFSFTGGSSAAFEAFLNLFIPPASTRTMCTMLQNMATGSSPTFLSGTSWLHTNMFRASESPSGSC